MKRLPTWAIVVLTSLLLFGGLLAVGFLLQSSAHQDPGKLAALHEISRAHFLAVGIPVEVLEALLWTAAFVELGARFARSAVLGAALGVLAYSVAYHWSGGFNAIVESGWIVLVLNASYLILRRRSRRVAILSTVGQKIAFITMGAVFLYPFGA